MFNSNLGVTSHPLGIMGAIARPQGHASKFIENFLDIQEQSPDQYTELTNNDPYSNSPNSQHSAASNSANSPNSANSAKSKNNTKSKNNKKNSLRTTKTANTTNNDTSEGNNASSKITDDEPTDNEPIDDEPTNETTEIKEHEPTVHTDDTDNPDDMDNPEDTEETAEPDDTDDIEESFSGSQITLRFMFKNLCIAILIALVVYLLDTKEVYHFLKSCSHSIKMTATLLHYCLLFLIVYLILFLFY
jgi:hypothetical protein